MSGFELFYATAQCWGNVPLFRPDQVRVFMTLSAMARSIPGGGTLQRQIELNWHGGGGPMAGDFVGLYQHDPSSNPANPLRRISVYSGGAGYFKTDVQFGFPILDRQLPIGDSCLGYWIAYVRNGAAMATNCLKIRPSWMWQNRFLLYISSIVLELKF